MARYSEVLKRFFRYSKVLSGIIAILLQCYSDPIAFKQMKKLEKE